MDYEYQQNTVAVKQTSAGHHYASSSSSQHVADRIQHMSDIDGTTEQKNIKRASSICCTPPPQVVCRMKRMGGGFGGKETRSVFLSCVAALAAHVTKRPVRVSLDRDVDMQITGHRHAFLAKYRAGATK